MMIGPMFFKETINYILIPFIMELTEIKKTLYNYLTYVSATPHTPNFSTTLEEILVQQLIIHRL